MASSNLSPYFQRALKDASSHPLLTSILGATILSASWIISDFYAWKAFGTGGTPPTWSGYYRMTKIRINHLLSDNDLLDPSPLSRDGPQYLKTPLAQRSGPRPKIMPRTMPQRQKPEPITPEARERLMALMQTLQTQHPDLLVIKPSKTEGGTTDAIYALPDLPKLNPLAKDRILDHEIAHAHPTENSLHVWLADLDAREVLRSGWGQRFPLTFVKSGWTMVYAPRTVEEVEVVERIVKAGIGWITGVEV